jgi:TPR repeat protein
MKHLVRVSLSALLISCCSSYALALTSGPPAQPKSEAKRSADSAKIKKAPDDNTESLDQMDGLYVKAREEFERGNKAAGMKLMRGAAEAGSFLAMHDLALRLRQQNTTESRKEAAVWYRRAAEWNGVGFAGSQNNLGDMYETGEGLPKSAGDAIYWYVRAALQGEPTAYLSLGSCFAKGVGVGRDLVEASFWLLLAAKNLGDGSNRAAAVKQLTEIGKSMTADQIRAAVQKAEAFVPYAQTKLTIGDPLARDTPEPTDKKQ